MGGGEGYETSKRRYVFRQRVLDGITTLERGRDRGRRGMNIYFSSWNEEGAGENGFTSDPEIRSGQRLKWPGTENESGSYPCRHALNNGNHETWSVKLSEEKLTQSEAPQNRDKWRDIVVTSCTTRDEQDRVSKQRIREVCLIIHFEYTIHGDWLTICGVLAIPNGLFLVLKEQREKRHKSSGDSDGRFANRRTTSTLTS